MKNAIAQRNYANALFEVASSQGVLDEVLIEIPALSEAFSCSPSLQNFLVSPLVTSEEKIRVVSSVLNAASLEKTTKNFVLLLVKNSRLSLIPGIIECLVQLKYARDGICKVKVCSALPLTKRSRSMLKESLETSLKRGVVLEEAADKSLLGGMRLEFEGKVVDMSTRMKLKKVLECFQPN